MNNEDGVGSPCGTPGYIPPETWQTEIWYPSGDVFSMGVVFFQMLTARVPGGNSDVCGVFQLGSEASDYAKAARDRPFPWHEFPQSMSGLRELIESMTQCDRHLRPHAAQAPSHHWFKSNSNAELPKTTTRNLVTAGEGHHIKETVMEQLQIMNNLDELRDLRDKVAVVSSDSSEKLRPLLEKYGVQHEVAATYASTACTGAKGINKFLLMVDETVVAKQSYSGHLVTELFDELDSDQNGALSPDELRA